MKVLAIYFFVLLSLPYSGKLYAQSTDTLNLKIKVEAIEIGGEDIPLKNFYTIDNEHNIFKIYLSANQTHVIYSYRLIDFERNQKIVHEWSTTKASYIKISNLFPRKYALEIIGKNATAQSNTLTIDFKVELPWWRSWWFWASCFVAMFGLFYGREKFLQFWAEEEQRHIKQVSELELRTLQLQMNPHFIFNALNAVQSFIITHDSISANNYLSKFAHLIRLFLDSSRSKYISLTDEVKLLSLYTEMEMLRFDNKFDVHLNIAHDVNRFVEIPTMILQPFVENAINHGLRYSDKKGVLSIDFFNQGKYLVCCIEDTGVGRTRAQQIQAKSRKGYKSQGLKIMEERLKIFNHIGESSIRFSIEDRIKNPSSSDIDVGTRVEIKFPRNS